MSSKNCRKYELSRKYQHSWENQFPWLKKDSSSEETAYCKVCQTKILPKLSNICSHGKSGKHQKNARAMSRQNSLPFPKVKKVDYEVKAERAEIEIAVTAACHFPIQTTERAEIEIAVTAACHFPIQNIDHLGEVIVHKAKGSVLENMKLHRTKCSKIITEVVAPALKEELSEDLKDKKYCIFIDESTDVSSTKNICIAVSYYSDKANSPKISYASTTEIIEATGKNIFDSVKKELEELGLQIRNCIALSCDGGSNMVGINNSLWSRIKQASPDCILMRCICHSLALAIQYGFDKLPANLGFLLSEVPKFFCNSALRREHYKQLYNTMNPDETMISPFGKLCETRWLVRGKVIRSLLANWNELKRYFAEVERDCKQDVRMKVRLICNEMENPYTYFYFIFAEPIVSEFERINQLFQSERLDPEKVLFELDIHYRSLVARVYDNSANELTLSRVDFGSQFLSETFSFVQASDNKEAAAASMNKIKERCQLMLLECVKQVKKRLPENSRVFQGLNALHPSKVISQTARVPFEQLPMRFLQKDNQHEIEQQYRKIVFIDWSSEVFAGKIPKDTADFWIGVKTYTDPAGTQHTFEKLATYALTCLIMPISNAVVERIFSTVTLTKTKVRNRMCLQMFDSLLRIKTHLYFSKQCCKNFKVSPRMLSLYTTKNMYETAQVDVSENDGILWLLQEDDVI